MTDSKNSVDVSYSQYFIRLITVCLFCTVALTLYFIGTINFVCVLLIAFGALWNFFVPINSFVSFVFCLVVCSLYALFSIGEGLYANAILYFFVYLIFQYLIWVKFSDKNMKIQDKQLSKITLYYLICAILVGLALCFAFSLLQPNHKLPLFDSFTACMLALSAFLQTFKYREYFIVSQLTLIFALLLWLFISYKDGFVGVSIAVVIMYFMYLILDVTTIIYRVKDIVYNRPAKKSLVTNKEKIQNKKATYQKMAEKELDNQGKDSSIKA